MNNRFQKDLLQKLMLLVFGASLLALPGCGEQGSDAGGDGRVTITFWHSFVSSTIPAFNALIARFEEEHPEIKINAQYVPTGDALVQKLITAVQSNSAPDISWVRANYMAELVQADAIYKIEDFAKGPDGLTQAELDDIYPALVQYASWKKTLFSMPMEATNLGLLYNKDHFRAAGLDPERPPQTWEELASYAGRLKQDENGDGRYERIGFMVPAVPATGPQGPYMVWQFIPFIWQAGGDLVNESQTRVLYGEEPAVRALELWKSIYQSQNQQSFTNDQAINAFASKQASMVLDGPWNLPRYPELLQGIDWGVAMLPAGPAKKATVVAGEYLAIFKQSKHPEEAWTFLKWMVQPEVQAFWAMESGYLPVRKSVLEVEEFQDFLEKNPAHRAFVEQMAFAQAQRQVDYNALEIERNLAVAIEQATVGGQDPATVLKRAAEASQPLLQPVARR